MWDLLGPLAILCVLVFVALFGDNSKMGGKLKVEWDVKIVLKNIISSWNFRRVSECRESYLKSRRPKQTFEILKLKIPAIHKKNQEHHMFQMRHIIQEFTKLF